MHQPEPEQRFPWANDFFDSLGRTFGVRPATRVQWNQKYYYPGEEAEEEREEPEYNQGEGSEGDQEESGDWEKLEAEERERREEM